MAVSQSIDAVTERQTEDALSKTPHVKRGVRMVLALIAVVDVAVLSAAVVVAWQLRLSVVTWPAPSESGLALASTAGPGVVVTWLLALARRGAYSTRVFGAGVEEYRAVLSASLEAAGFVGLFCYLVNLDLSRGFVFLVFAIGTPTLLLWRYLARQIVHLVRAHGHLLHRVVAVGGRPAVEELVGILMRERRIGFKVVGACLPWEAAMAGATVRGVPVVGSVESARLACAKLYADTVLVAGGAYESSTGLRRLAWDLQGSNVELVVVPSLTEVAGPRIHMRPVAGLPLLHLREPQVDEAGGWSKRLFDIIGTSIALVLLSPILLAVAVAIRFEDGGPVLFRQRRIGLGGSEFACLKFRSMSADAESRELALREAAGHSGPLWKMEADPRVTRVGRLLRRYSIDELPQLLNVLMGDMSLVGPRPQQAWEVESYSASDHRRLLVCPGMTGLWQVSGRSRLSFEEAIRLDLYYVDNWSLTTDLVIMAKTLKAVVAGNGAF